ncbi:phospholipase D family protein [Paenirhodobacter hankyongi]|uniref:NgoFVII family restriction endonuclease n=1 Tax=Paenirhodobacter hankyongi TaxID=2294033 RepID=A0A421BJ13_9RHOB|nr:phospholipase D family protein [Sinirhodobacter hankyongi]RLL61555.1 NgoFVII family restriction endonuclease [Sinirhodobacter hankyongi]
MAHTQSIQLLLNDESTDHRTEIGALLKNARHLECMVAFAKVSGWQEMKAPLKKALSKGMTARLAVGLDFYHTDPALLHDLFRLSSNHNLKLYLSNSQSTFHPKIYAFEASDGCKVVVGSANFTLGGLLQNYEASVLIDDESGAMMKKITEHFDDLIENEEIVPATKPLIDGYAKDHAINAAWARFARRRAARAVDSGEASLDVLADFLRMMQEGDASSPFNAQMKVRRGNLAVAPTQLRSIAAWKGKTAHGFLTEYERLIGSFHSGGLNRAKTRIADKRKDFVRAVASIIDHADLSPRDAFATLHAAFANIEGAGINLLTEILHTLDNTRFAVMNQNAVAGLRLAGYDEFPLHPSKGNVSPDKYQLYCDHADAVCKALGLRDFTELDALFNYVYWHEDRPDDDGGDDED